jgi:hypothetical protein
VRRRIISPPSTEATSAASRKIAELMDRKRISHAGSHITYPYYFRTEMKKAAHGRLTH